MFNSLKLSDLPEKNTGILRKSSSTRPSVWIIEEDGLKAVVKDFSSNGYLFRNTAGRFLIWRESRAYDRLKNIKGIPAIYRNMEGLALVMEKIQGNSLEEIEDKVRIEDHFFESLVKLIDSVHERGICHCDLKRSPNIMISDEGLPCIIDWGASISSSEFPVFPLNLIYRRFCRDDYLAVIKLKIRHRPDLVSPEERDAYQCRSLAEKIIRSARNNLRKLIKKIA